ncbi:MaoC/PaaZ C-terminal domain-containing protein [Cupriavidus oxalaticus]|uniref:3-alpha,7-alpha, 12-alpha-trihydroxy-5-beta-cholest-24-enoyl-CoA hydratase n=1 Tax=Cupriavidus oxalaticus TaxID=96344 RepID=A0A375GQZ2_9BURK|nr:MaoC/PaaZ C-terminal domain-containing protein [Cupriavidus oxalaticus]QRQ85519.1 MaoC family dehydratase N-terminal domain-containing protein [Cupriavidus oxalaticus]QRQ90393.1 MaoC family dehydratase N-terminal domain-containing protein [Cupriavidus oxalaticus]WQD84908.1 MaoC/PaaZ C-terminal domain-containing protein [Cupriavidus oxalaticus]SPC09906.1 3-alpha,7-alpha, 12-alpha-trihydroxy-5-beta-cholest-24-enoyl-CoA hydratase [Cupriavidus oxalaticus]SPC24336.1 3-alpha,7-alpha, 12-alpha-tri
MAVSYQHLKQRPFAPVRQRYTERDTMLYALSLGLGNDPLDAAALPFVFEGAAGGLRTLPSQAVVLGYPGFWAREADTGIDWVKLLHGEQRMRLHRPLPASADIVGHNRITHLTDKGEGKGAIMVTERRLETAEGELLATVQQISFLRGDGGYSQRDGGQPSDDPLPALRPTPEDRAPDFTDTQAIRPEAALLYRLMGDFNPLHADPAVAKAAGFERPILHGLASYGLVAHALVRQCADHDPARLRALDIRFTAPVFPGETLVTEIWRTSESANHFQVRARVAERDKVVLSHGCAEIA